jgi:hypothetical protein
VLALGEAAVRAVGLGSQAEREALAEETNSHLGAAAHSLVGRPVLAKRAGRHPSVAAHVGGVRSCSRLKTKRCQRNRIARRRGSRKESQNIVLIMGTSTLHVAREFIRQFALTGELERLPSKRGVGLVRQVKPVGPWLVSPVFPH